MLAPGSQGNPIIICLAWRERIVCGKGLEPQRVDRRRQPIDVPRRLSTWPSGGSAFDYIERYFNPKREHVGNGRLQRVECKRRQALETEAL